MKVRIADEDVYFGGILLASLTLEALRERQRENQDAPTTKEGWPTGNYYHLIAVVHSSMVEPLARKLSLRYGLEPIFKTCIDEERDYWQLSTSKCRISISYFERIHAFVEGFRAGWFS